MPDRLTTKTARSLRSGRAWLLLAVLCGLAGCADMNAPTRASPAAATQTVASFESTLRLADGSVRLTIDSRAAPLAVAELKRALASGGFDGVAIDWIRPHVEIRTGVPIAAPAAMASELDAVALGLDRELINDTAAAMNLIRMELEPALLRAGNDASPQLQAWVRQWRAQFDPGFLIGVSRQQINEALGYRYQRGYASRPARRGSVALLPAMPGRTSLALAILLTDQPERDGRWVVVGHVSAGLELVDRISVAPRVHPKFNAPVAPVLIQHTTLSPGRR